MGDWLGPGQRIQGKAGAWGAEAPRAGDLTVEGYVCKNECMLVAMHVLRCL